MVSATPVQGKVATQGKGKAHSQPNDVTAVTTDSRVSAASTRSAVLKAANQAVQDNYLWSFSREGKFSGPDCDAAVFTFPPRLAKVCHPYNHYFGKSEDGSDKTSIHDMSQRAFPAIFDLAFSSST